MVQEERLQFTQYGKCVWPIFLWCALLANNKLPQCNSQRERRRCSQPETEQFTAADVYKNGNIKLKMFFFFGEAKMR